MKVCGCWAVAQTEAAGAGRVRVYPGSDLWYGVTYREDLDRLASVFKDRD